MSMIRRAVTTPALLLAILIAAGTGPLPPSLAQETGATVVFIDGDAALRIATSTPDATVQIVAGGTGLYRRGAGEDWTRTGHAPPGDGAIVFAANDPDLALTGDHPPCLRGGEATPLTRTEDGGETWIIIDGATDIRPLAVWAESGVAIGSSCAGFMLSTDTGLTWTAVEAAEPAFEITASAVVAEPAGTDGPVVLFGETSEGGSSQFRTLDLAEPTAPVVSGALRDYYGVAGLCGSGALYVIAAIDGVWLSTDAGLTWTRTAEGLETVVLEDDPAQVGIPADVAMDQVGLFAIAFLPGNDGGLAVGSANGLLVSRAPGEAWTSAGEVKGRIDQVVASEGDNRLLLRSNDAVLETTLEP